MLMLWQAACLGVPQSTTTSMAGYGKMSPKTAPAFDSAFPVPMPGSLHKWYSGLPDNSSCEVLLAVSYSSVNPSDIHPTMALSDHYPKPMGSDVAGIVQATHGECMRLRVGDEVWGDIGANTHTASGAKTKELGAYAQFAVALESQLSVVPSHLAGRLDEAGSLPKVALTSYKALTWFGRIGDRPATQRKVLILGGSGGTGSVAVQLAKHAFNGTLVTVTTSAKNFEYLRSLGADVLIDYHTEDWWNTSVVAAASQDIVYDCVGEAGTGDRAVQKLRAGGDYVTITGALASGALPPGTAQHAFINSDTNLGSANLLEQLASLSGAAALRMPKLTSYDLSDVSQAFAQSQSGHVDGKLIIRVPAASDEQFAAVADMWRTS